MITANLYHIKATNGLFYYGLDYLKENIDLVRKVLVRPALMSKIGDILPGVEIVPCTVSRYLSEVWRACRSGDLLYTPTSHPLPGVNHQMIVVHDVYPFEAGSSSALKRFLLRLSLSLSQSKVGYINTSDALPFVRSLGVSVHRMLFAPNRFPEPAQLASRVASPDGVTVVGLVGTDSAKKNYGRLFNAVRAAGLTTNLVFRVFGHDTTYFRDTLAQFPDVHFVLVKSDVNSLDEFLSRVDVLASASEQEGFGRPVAAALLAGVPVELLDSAVFREFFSGGARFHADVVGLVESLHRQRERDPTTRYLPPTKVVAGYLAANREIRRLGSVAGF